MDLVLGLSVTSTAVRWVLVEGTSGEGAPVDRGALDITDDAPFDADGLLSVLLDANEPVVESGVHAVGVTWTTDADAAALAVLEALDARGVQNVVSVSAFPVPLLSDRMTMRSPSGRCNRGRPRSLFR